MHSGSVLSGSDAGNANTELKMSIQLFVGWVTCTYTGSTGSFFRCLEVGGDFCKDTCEAKLFGMQIGSVLSGLDAGNANTDAKMSIVGNVYE